MSAPRGSLDINGEIITLAEIKKRAHDLRHASGEATTFDHGSNWEDEAAQGLIERTLLVQESARLHGEPPAASLEALLAQSGKRYDGVAGCRAGSNTAELREDLRRRVLIDALLERWRSAIRRPSAEEVRSTYAKNKAQFWMDEQVWAFQLVRPLEEGLNADAERSLCETLRERVAAGEDFASLAGQYSGCPENGGDLGWLRRGIMVEPFDEMVFSTMVGQLTPVFQTLFGFHFALVRGRKEAGIPSLNEIRSQVEDWLWRQKQERYAVKQLQLLEEQARIRRIV